MNRKERRLKQSQSKKQKKIFYHDKSYTADEAFALAVQQENLKNEQEAQDIYQNILAQVPDHTYSLNNLGLLMFSNDAVEEAIHLYRRAIQYSPDYAFAWHNLGDALMSMGKMQEAEQMFLKALAINPEFSNTLYSLAHMRRYTSVDHPDIKRIRTLTDKGTANGKEYLYFSLGKAYDDCGLYDEAFTYYQLANQICKASVTCNHAAISRDTDIVTQIFTRDLLTQSKAMGSDSQTPLFIVGMPRSGTTLLGNILSNHPAIESAGELPTMIECSKILPKLLGSTMPYPHAVQQITPEAAAILIKRYETRLRRDVCANATYIIDKHPINFSRLGLIAMLFPNAKVIHCTRNPLDTCLSNYFQKFSPEFYYSFDLQDIGHFYSGYAKLMAHWKEVLPMQMLEISYEDMVMNMEQTARKAIAFLGLAWDERCLSPHTNPQIVKTASVWQVRQPVYMKSKERWRHYEKHLAPLKAALPQV